MAIQTLKKMEYLFIKTGLYMLKFISYSNSPLERVIAHEKTASILIQEV
jgi:hypothetical protein